MNVGNRARRIAIAGTCALALASAAPSALADPTKPTTPVLPSTAPLGDGTTLVHDTPITDDEPGGKDDYDYDATVIYWSVVAVRPTDAKADLTLFSTPGTGELAASRERKSKVDFIGVDSDEAPVPTIYYPQVRSKGTGSYTIELDANADILFDDNPRTIDFTENDVVFVADAYGDADTTYMITVESTPGVNPSIYVMHSDTDNPATYYQGKAQALVKADHKPAGKPEKVTFTGIDDFYGIVIINEGGAGTVTVTKTII